MALILILQGVKLELEGSETFENLVQISKKTKLLDDDHVKVISSQGSDLSGIDYRKCIIILKNMINIPLIREALENHLISNIEKKEEKSGNTPLHAAAGTVNDQVLRFLLNNGASVTQFIINNDGKIPLEISKNNKYMFRLVLIDFLNYALKSPKFSTNKFQDQLGSGLGFLNLPFLANFYKLTGMSGTYHYDF